MAVAAAGVITGVIIVAICVIIGVIIVAICACECSSFFSIACNLQNNLHVICKP